MAAITAKVYKEQQAATASNPPTKSAGNLNLSQFYSLMYHVLDIIKPKLIFGPAYPKYNRTGQLARCQQDWRGRDFQLPTQQAGYSPDL